MEAQIGTAKLVIETVTDVIEEAFNNTLRATIEATLKRYEEVSRSVRKRVEHMLQGRKLS